MPIGRIGPMPRAPLARRRILVGVLLTGVLASCAPDAPAPTRPSASPTVSPSTAAPRAPIPTGTAPARTFAVGLRTLRFDRGPERPLPVTIWYPAHGPRSAAARPGLPVADGRFPVVLFSHGLSTEPTEYAPLVTAWAAAGFVVVAPSYPHTRRGAPEPAIVDVVNQPADASHVLTEVLALDRTEGDPLAGHLNTDQVAAAGHSAGAITTIGLFTVARDPRLDAGVVLAGSALGVGTAFSGSAAPLLFVHGELDDVISFAAGQAVYDQVPWPKAMLRLPEGDHGRNVFRADSRALDVVVETTVEFLRWALYGDVEAKRRLPAVATRHGVAVFDNRL